VDIMDRRGLYVFNESIKGAFDDFHSKHQKS